MDNKSKFLEYNVEKEEITFLCSCGNVISYDVSNYECGNVEIEGFEDQFYNLTIPCNCGLEHDINMNIPIGEYEELELELYVMPFEEINARKYLRDLIWAKRVDLKEVDRKVFNEEQKLQLFSH